MAKASNLKAKLTRRVVRQKKTEFYKKNEDTGSFFSEMDEVPAFNPRDVIGTASDGSGRAYIPGDE